MARYWPTPGFKGRTFKLCVFIRWDLNFCVRSSPQRGPRQYFFGFLSRRQNKIKRNEKRSSDSTLHKIHTVQKRGEGGFYQSRKREVSQGVESGMQGGWWRTLSPQNSSPWDRGYSWDKLLPCHAYGFSAQRILGDWVVFFPSVFIVSKLTEQCIWEYILFLLDFFYCRCFSRENVKTLGSLWRY